MIGLLYGKGGSEIMEITYTTADHIKDGDVLCWNVELKEYTKETPVKTVSYYRGRKPFQIKVEYESGGVSWFRKKEKVYIKGIES